MSGQSSGRWSQKKVHLLDTGRGLPRIVRTKEEPFDARPSMPATSDKRPRRRDRARRSLVETLSAKRPIAVGSTGGVAHPGRDRKLQAGWRPPAVDGVMRRDITGPRINQRRSLRSGCDGLYGGELRAERSASSHNNGTSLPELVHELNARFVRSQRRDKSHSGDSDSELYNGEDVVKILNRRWERSMRTKHDSEKQWGKYRPITPNLIEKLNKLKVSSKSRTEEWVKQIPTEKRAYHSSLYRLGHVVREADVTSPVVYDSWIYEEGRK